MYSFNILILKSIKMFDIVTKHSPTDDSCQLCQTDFGWKPTCVNCEESRGGGALPFSISKYEWELNMGIGEYDAHRGWIKPSKAIGKCVIYEIRVY